jgi:membrane fusion protein (multidrug efflux system)
MDTASEQLVRGGEASKPDAPRASTAPAAAGGSGTGKKKRLRVIAAVVAVAVGAAALLYWLHSRHFEDTDDAQVDGDISNVGSRVAGVVRAVYVKENQRVRAGETLLELDTADLEVLVRQARARVDQAKAALEAASPRVSITETANVASVAGQTSEVSSSLANLAASKQQIAQIGAQLDQARATSNQAELDRQRDERLLKSASIAQAEYDRAHSVATASAAGVRALEEALAAARDRLGEAEARLAAARTKLGEVRSNAPRQVDTERASVEVGTANLELAQAQLAQAELELAYARVIAPADGFVGKKSVAVGDHVVPGQALVALVLVQDMWVTANFRETQLKRMRPGQAAKIHVDAIDVDLTGSVESIGGATGSRLSVLPPENASGNYVKVVQRLPVRVRIDPGQTGFDRLRPGMSVEPRVTVR